MTNKLQQSNKGELHPRNKHIGQYDFESLIKACPDLAPFVITNPKGSLSINFSDAQSVLLLNKALLAYFYQINFWQIPAGYLCPPIPGRVDYLHYLADLLAESTGTSIPTGSQIKGLDIGCGANCIYPILGSRSYEWSFVGSDIDPLAVKTASLLVSANVNISKKISIRLQKNKTSMFTGIIKSSDRFAFTLCNPPFHASMEKAAEGSLLKQKNLKKNAFNETVDVGADILPSLNFSGQDHELSCAGGEVVFIKQMIEESVLFKTQVCWFTCLVSKSSNINPLKKCLANQPITEMKVVEMAQGHKISRFIAWTYLTVSEQKQFLVK